MIWCYLLEREKENKEREYFKIIFCLFIKWKEINNYNKIFVFCLFIKVFYKGCKNDYFIFIVFNMFSFILIYVIEKSIDNF